MVRGAGGSNDHPDPLLFAQVFRLMSFYSLVKPPKGSNVEKETIYNALISIQDEDEIGSKHEWDDILNEIVDKNSNENRMLIEDDHDYDVTVTSDYALGYFAGFVAKHLQKWTSCEECILNLTDPEPTGADKDAMIDELNRGKLQYPSLALFQLLQIMEKVILYTVGKENVCINTIVNIAKKLAGAKITFVG